MAGRTFVPMYKQPFTLEEATQLEIPTLTAEISRLQGSINLLNETQAQLQAEIDANSSPDPDFVEAFEDNKLTIASQEERIHIICLALEAQGVPALSNPHYGTIIKPPGNNAHDSHLPASTHAVDGGIDL